MSLLLRYRQQLVDEAAGRSHRFADILRHFRRFWLFCVGLGVAFLAYGVWVGFTEDLSGGAGMALIIFPVGAVLIAVAGGAVYGFAQLFLSVRKTSDTHDNG